MSRSHVIALMLLSLTAGLFGCDTIAPVPTSKIVVEAYLQGGTPMGSVRLTRSVEPGEAYVPSGAAVRGATVEVHRLADDGTPAARISFEETAPGVYEPVSPPTVRPLATYELMITTPGGNEVTATTTVPDTISIVESRNETVVYQGPAQPSFTITAPRSDRDRQDVLVVTTTSLLDFDRPEEELRKRLTPLYRDDYDPAEDSLETLRTTSSGVLNEANFERDEQGRITTQLPWISVAFYGPNEAAIHVIDDNLYDLIRSQQAQSPGEQGGGLGPGELPNVIEHVEGGTGIFGSYVRDTKRVSVQRPSNETVAGFGDGWSLPSRDAGRARSRSVTSCLPPAPACALRGNPRRERRGGQ